jgi:hypothetical protein
MEASWFKYEDIFPKIVDDDRLKTFVLYCGCVALRDVTFKHNLIEGKGDFELKCGDKFSLAFFAREFTFTITMKGDQNPIYKAAIGPVL